MRARAIVNAAGPWVGQFLTQTLAEASPIRVKLVQGSHIIVPRLYDGDHAFILQNDDRRVVFVYPYEGVYTLIGTTDVALDGDPRACRASADEIGYLCRAANRYFAREVTPADVVWSYCGVRALVDDGARNPSRVTRDYMLRVDGSAERARCCRSSAARSRPIAGSPSARSTGSRPGSLHYPKLGPLTRRCRVAICPTVIWIATLICSALNMPRCHAGCCKRL